MGASPLSNHMECITVANLLIAINPDQDVLVTICRQCLEESPGLVEADVCKEPGSSCEYCVYPNTPESDLYEDTEYYYEM